MGAEIWFGILQAAVLIVALVLLYRPIGDYMAYVFSTGRDLRVERGIYRVIGVDPASEQTWRSYARSVLTFSVVGVLLLYALQLLLPWQANGSMLPDDKGSALIGQSFTDGEGNALPKYFQSRPSATNYDGTASGGSNLGPSNADLVTTIGERNAAIAKREGVAINQVPADAVTASASGLDPHISVAYALLQVPRVAEARHLPAHEARDRVESRIQGRDLGFLGEERINVAELNLALDKLEGE